MSPVHRWLRRAVGDERGDLLIDAVVGTVMVALAAALIGPLFNATGVSRESTRKQTDAANLASAILEDTQGLPFSSVTSSGLATALVEGKYPNIGTPAQAGWQVTRVGTTYSISLTVSEVPETSGHERQVTVSLTWPGGGTMSRATSVTDSLTSALPTSPATGEWISEFAFSPTGSSFMIAAGADKNLWFTEPSENKIGKITLSGTITHYTVPTASSTPRGIAAGPDGNLWFTEPSTNKIGRITPAGVFTEFPSGAATQPIMITAGPDGNLWFTEQSSNTIGKITTSGTVTHYTIPTVGSTPKGIAAGPDNNLWFTEYARGKIGKVTTSGTITEYTVPSASTAYPVCITKGPDGNLWFTQAWPANKISKITTSGVITQYTITNEVANPYGITAGPDGNLWFAEQGTDTIGRITTSGTITEYRASASDGPTGITTGADNNLWFTESFVGKIGRINSGV